MAMAIFVLIPYHIMHKSHINNPSSNLIGLNVQNIYYRLNALVLAYNVMEYQKDRELNLQ
jgi:hypothetical protein